LRSLISFFPFLFEAEKREEEFLWKSFLSSEKTEAT